MSDRVSGPPRVVVTGIGLVTPFARSREASWRMIRRGERAARDVVLPLEGPAVQATGRKSLSCFGAPAALEAPSDGDTTQDRIVRLALEAAREAWRDAGLDRRAGDPERLGCVVGTSKGGLRSFSDFVLSERDGGPDDPRKIGLWRQFLPETPALAVAAEFGAKGPSLCPVAACATGLASLQRGVDLIRDGACDVVLAGSTDASLTPLVVASFQRLGVLARGERAENSGRPFDLTRNGFVIGEGAAVLILEREESAAARGATAYAEWLSGGMLADAAGLTSVDPSGAGLRRLIGEVLARGGVEPHEVDYVNLHGTGTRENDACETRGVRAAFGAAADGLSCSSLKGAMGHLLGSAGSVEMACTLLAIRDGIAPPTVNLETRDPECDLDYTPGIARLRPIATALKLSLGFGGHLAGGLVGRRRTFAWRRPENR